MFAPRAVRKGPGGPKPKPKVQPKVQPKRPLDAAPKPSADDEAPKKKRRSRWDSTPAAGGGWDSAPAVSGGAFANLAAASTFVPAAAGGSPTAGGGANGGANGDAHSADAANGSAQGSGTGAGGAANAPPANGSPAPQTSAPAAPNGVGGVPAADGAAGARARSQPTKCAVRSPDSGLHLPDAATAARADPAPAAEPVAAGSSDPGTAALSTDNVSVTTSAPLEQESAEEPKQSAREPAEPVKQPAEEPAAPVATGDPYDMFGDEEPALAPAAAVRPSCSPR